MDNIRPDFHADHGRGCQGFEAASKQQSRETHSVVRLMCALVEITVTEVFISRVNGRKQWVHLSVVSFD
jgi:hypothetical protein